MTIPMFFDKNNSESICTLSIIRYLFDGKVTKRTADLRHDLMCHVRHTGPAFVHADIHTGPDRVVITSALYILQNPYTAVLPHKGFETACFKGFEIIYSNFEQTKTDLTTVQES